MTLINTEILIPCDIDFTLLMWGTSPKPTDIDFFDPYTETFKKVAPNVANIRVVKNWLARGATILVWSRSGPKWAEHALMSLGLDHKNILVSSKPLAYIDDKPCEQWMGERVNLDSDDPWGKTNKSLKPIAKGAKKCHSKK